MKHGRATWPTARQNQPFWPATEFSLPTTVLDGELVVLREGKPSLQHIQQRALLQNRQRIQGLSRSAPATYMVFDLLYLKGKPFMASPLSLLREALQTLLEQISLPGVLVPQGILRYGCRMFDKVGQLKLEGIMAKRLDGPYLPGKRSGHWLKIKPRQSFPKDS